MTAARSRFAIYFTPPADSELNRFGSLAIGRDPLTGSTTAPRPIDGFPSDRWTAATASARRYGFHATLKPPFRLRDGQTEDQLAGALAQFAMTHAPVPLPALRVSRITNFIALTLDVPCSPLSALADACVQSFDVFRAAPAVGELARRRDAALTPRQVTLLERWGYPYVFDEWRFHMTLATGLSPLEIEAVLPPLTGLAAPSCAAGTVVDAISLLVQIDDDSPFMLVRRCPLRGRHA